MFSKMIVNLDYFLQQKLDVAWYILENSHKKQWIEEHIISLINGISAVMQLAYRKMNVSNDLWDLTHLMQLFLMIETLSHFTLVSLL